MSTLGILLLAALGPEPQTLRLAPPALELAVESEERSDVPYVPTADAVVERMLEMAEVKKGDVVYDLGCGDGRIVVAAAARGARGVGVDLDPERISESRANAKRAGVTRRVEFRQGNLFDVDVTPASVVTLYLLPDVNLKLRPRLLEQLRPGTRVVSHDFNMGEWEPDETETVHASREHTVHFWVVPVEAAGGWQLQAKDGEDYALELDQRFQKLEGTLIHAGQRTPVRGRVRGTQIELDVGQGAGRKLVGRLEGDLLTLRQKGGTLELTGGRDVAAFGE